MTQYEFSLDAPLRGQEPNYVDRRFFPVLQLCSGMLNLERFAVINVRGQQISDEHIDQDLLRVFDRPTFDSRLAHGNNLALFYREASGNATNSKFSMRYEIGDYTLYHFTVTHALHQSLVNAGEYYVITRGAIDAETFRRQVLYQVWHDSVMSRFDSGPVAFRFFIDSASVEDRLKLFVQVLSSLS